VTSRSLPEARSSARPRPFWLALLPALLGQVAAGCIDPKADYQDFQSRPVLAPEAGVMDAPIDVALTPCEELLQQNPTGSYYVSCVPQATMQPFGLAVDLSATVMPGGGGTLGFSFSPLLNGATTLADTYGPPVVGAASAISADCTFVQTIGTFSLPASTNPLMLDIVADGVVLRGKLQTVDSACGDLDGNVVMPPLPISLNGNGDICMFIRLGPGDPLPAIPNYTCDPTQLPPP
jgi:hypothetical protein